MRDYFEMFKRVNKFSIEMVVNASFFIIVLMTNQYFIGTVNNTELTTGVGMGGSIFILLAVYVQ